MHVCSVLLYLYDVQYFPYNYIHLRYCLTWLNAFLQCVFWSKSNVIFLLICIIDTLIQLAGTYGTNWQARRPICITFVILIKRL